MQVLHSSVPESNDVPLGRKHGLAVLNKGKL